MEKRTTTSGLAYFGGPSGFRKTRWFLTFSRQLHLSFSAAWRLLISAQKTPKTGALAGFRIQPIASGAFEKPAGGGRGIRTPEGLHLSGFQARP